MKNYQLKSFSLLIIIVMMFGSCATMFTSPVTRINFKSEPSGAKIYIDGVENGTTNSFVEVRRKGGKENPVVRYSKENYNDITFYLERKPNPARYLNIPLIFVTLIGGIIGYIVDFSNGTAYKYKYDNYEKTLEPKK